MRDAFALDDGPYHFCERSSRRAAASSICSARSFFSFAFSSSSCFSRFASGTSMPPYLAFQLYSVASETPCLRAKSAVFAPASCSRSTPIICSSVNLARFICPSFRRPDSNFNLRKSAEAGQHHDQERGGRRCHFRSAAVQAFPVQGRALCRNSQRRMRGGPSAHG